ncbi:MAG: SHOCT domain-containing protein [Dehalococcoidia bacterium]|nr:SHOCT domain-containing protein [Dehalococcoidia bacterium]
MNTILLLAIAHGGRGDHMNWGWGGWLLTALMVAAFCAVLAALIFGLVRWAGRRPLNPPPPAADSALQIVRERFARGEITEEEFERMTRRLS